MQHLPQVKCSTIDTVEVFFKSIEILARQRISERFHPATVVWCQPFCHEFTRRERIEPLQLCGLTIQ